MAILTIEQGNHLSKGSLYKVKWIRPPGSRAPGQEVANLVIITNSLDTANCLIRQGLVVEGTKVPVRKLEHDLVRCLKCQSYGTSHIAANCKQSHDTCRTCAGRHRTNHCKERNPDKYSCISCKECNHQHKHALWDKLCPTYLELKHKIDECNPKTGYKYFLTEDPATWEKSDSATGLSRPGGNGWKNTRRWNTHVPDSGWKNFPKVGNTGTRVEEPRSRVGIGG